MLPCVPWRCALPQTALITGRTFPGLSRRSSPFHEPMAVGQGEATPGRAAPHRMDCSLAEWLASPATTFRLGQLYVRLSRRRRGWPWPSGTDCKEDWAAPRRPIVSRGAQARSSLGMEAALGSKVRLGDKCNQMGNPPREGSLSRVGLRITEILSGSLQEFWFQRPCEAQSPDALDLIH